MPDLCEACEKIGCWPANGCYCSHHNKEEDNEKEEPKQGKLELPYNEKN